MATATSTLIHSVKIILMSTGVLFIAILLAPQISNFTAPQLPAIWSSLRSWLRPPYLYVIINGIIITIAASSRLHHHQKHPVFPSPATDTQEFRQIHHHNHFRSSAVPADAFTYAEQQDVHSVPEPVPESSPLPVPVHEPLPALARFGESDTGAVVESHVPAEVNYDETATFEATETVGFDEVEEDEEEEEEEKAIVVKEDVLEKARNDDFAPVDGSSEESLVVAWRSTLSKPPPPPPAAPLARQETSEIVSSFFQSQIEKPPPSARFGHHRRPTRATPEGGKALRVAKPKRNETLESTWKKITEGRPMPLKRHLKKSDTWENHSRQAASSDPVTPSPVKKSETFTDRTNYSPAAAYSGTRLKKEPSLGQEELNRRVEAFINKVNNEMRLQRQQSIQQYMEMTNRAA